MKGVYIGLALGDDRRVEPERVVRSLAERQHGVVGRRQLRHLGIGHDGLRRLYRNGWLEDLSGAVMRLVGTPLTDLQRAMAAILDSPPGAVLSHTSAAAFWGLPGFDLSRGALHVTIPRQGRTQRQGLTVVHYQKDLPAGELVIRDGIPVTTPTLLIFHLAAILHPARTERAFDNAVARRLTSVKRLGSLTREIGARGRNGTRLARQLSARHDGYAPTESSFESRVEWCADQSETSVQRQVSLGDHELVGRVDFRLVGLSGVIEAQSVLYHSSPMSIDEDTERIERLLQSGFSVLTVWDYQAFHYPDTVITEIARFREDVRKQDEPFYRECPDP